MSDENRYRIYLECIEAPVVALNEELKIEYCNAAYARIFSRSSEELEGMSILDVIPEYTGSKSHKAYLQSMDLYSMKTVEAKIGNKSFIERIFPTPNGVISLLSDTSDNKRFEEMIKALTRSYHDVFDEARDAIIIFDTYTTNILEVNRSACDLFDYPREEILKLNMGDLCADEAPYTRGEFMRWLRKSSDVEPQYMEWKARDRSGRHFWIDVKSRRMSVGKQIRLVAIIRDNTTIKRVEKSLRQLAEMYGSFLDNAGDILFVHDLGGNFITISPVAEKITGYTVEELVRMNIQDLAEPECLPFLRGFQYQRLTSGRHVKYDLTIHNKNSQKVYLEIVIWPLYRTGKPIAVQGLARDVSERKQKEQALKTSEQNWMSFVKWLPDATLAINLEGKVVAWNQAMEELTGIKAEEMMGKGNYEYALAFYNTRRPIMVDLVLRPDEIKQYYSITEEDNYTVISEFATPHLRGGGHYLWGKAMPWYNKDGELLGAIECLRDVTDRYGHRMELKRKQQEAEESQQFLLSIIDNTAAAMLNYDEHGNITYASKKLTDLLGYEPEELNGQKLLDLAKNSVDKAILQTGLKNDANISARSYEVQLSKKDGSQQAVKIMIKPIIVEDKVGSGWVQILE